MPRRAAYSPVDYSVLSEHSFIKRMPSEVPNAKSFLMVKTTLEILLDVIVCSFRSVIGELLGEGTSSGLVPFGSLGVTLMIDTFPRV